MLMPMRLFVFILVIVSVVAIHEVFETEDHSYVLIDFKSKTFRHISDLNTAKVLGIGSKNVSVISAKFLSLLEKGDEVPAISSTSEPWTRSNYNDQVNHRLAITMLYDPADYFAEIIDMEGNTAYKTDKITIVPYNPSILKLPDKKILINWRSPWDFENPDTQAKFGFYSLEKHSVVERPDFVIPHSVIRDGDKSLKQDDLRMILTDTNADNCTILCVFTSVYKKTAMQTISYGTYNYAKQTLEFAPSKLLEFLDGSQKNWVPFMYEKQVYFFQNLYPVRVVQAGNEILHSNQEENQNIVGVSTIAKTSKLDDFPWDTELFGELRGGTPAIMLRGVLFTVFHTQVGTVYKGSRYTYFMGAVTYCPYPPFHMHSVSKVPMLKKEWYEGEYSSDQVGYMLFPDGIIIDDDEQHIWISVGTKDLTGYMMKLNIDKLFDSLEVVRECHSSLKKE